MAASKLSALLSASRKPTAADSSTILGLIDESRLHRPDLVLEHGESALSYHSSSTKTHWDIIAQIVRAAAELGEQEIVNTYIKKIMERFPHSVRAFTLLGITHEACGKLADASGTYISILKKESLAPGVYKRQVAILKSQKKIGEAVTMLNYYLNFYASDFDAWAELCALSLRLGRFSHALFAANEMVLLSPENDAVHITVADVYMTVDGAENLLLARAHYARSLDIRKQANLRALYGLWLSCSILVDGGLVDQLEREKSLKLLSIAQKGIRSVYGNSSTGSVGAFVATTLGTDVFTGKKRVKKMRE